MPLYPDVKVQLVGSDGNAFAIMGKVSQALKRAGHGDVVGKYTEESMAGDYDNLLVTACKYVTVS